METASVARIRHVSFCRAQPCKQAIRSGLGPRRQEGTERARKSEAKLSLKLMAAGIPGRGGAPL
jgi:hypothetical protein